VAELAGSVWQCATMDKPPSGLLSAFFAQRWQQGPAIDAGFDQITLAAEALGEATRCRYKRRFRYELCAMSRD